MITSWKLGPAIATGNALIIKTPELSPLYGQKLAQLVVEAGFPPGVISILCGLGHEAGQAIAEHMLIRKISFTGSDRTGRSLLRASANTNLKKISLELGGKGPSIVFQEADLNNAAFWTSLGATANNGQVCALGSRIYVHESIYDHFIDLFKQQYQYGTEPGDPVLADTSKGPLISRAQFEKVLGYVRKGQEEGAKILIGGNSTGKGLFIENTVFTDTREDMKIVKEEIFGPVAVSKNETLSSSKPAIPICKNSFYSTRASDSNI